MSSPKDVADYAAKNKDLMQAAQENPEVSRTFIGIVDRLIEIFGKDADLLPISGPTGAAKPFDVKFTIGEG